MGKSIDLKILINRVIDKFSSVEGVKAIYIIDFDSMDMQYHIFSDEKPTKEKLELIKASVKLFNNKDVETAYIEEKDRLFLKRLKDTHIVITVVTNNQSRMGNIFSLLKLILI